LSEIPAYQAQNGEDRWLDAHFGGKREGFFVEVGAYDGVRFSNSYFFEQRGWRGVLVEPDPAMAERCRTARSRSMVYACAVGAPGSSTEVVFFQVTGGEVYSTTRLDPSHRQRLQRLGLPWREVRVPMRTLDAILDEVSAPKIDFVTIDVEGGELDVLRGFDLGRWKPQVVVVETNAPRRDPAIGRYFVSRGYAYHHSIDVNDFYLPSRAAAAVDAWRYLRYRLARRMRRLGQLARRAWTKHIAR
jgi:FkbM family methyltransferase